MDTGTTSSIADMELWYYLLDLKSYDSGIATFPCEYVNISNDILWITYFLKFKSLIKALKNCFIWR